MYENVPCPNRRCRGGKIQKIVGVAVFYDYCPTCGGLGFVKRRIPDYIIERRHRSY